eukprot:1766711-Ditylum_brightwellii.AAC.1
MQSINAPGFIKIQKQVMKSVISNLLPTRKGQNNKAPKFGINMKPNLTKGLELYVDASFVGDWNQA